MKKNSYVLLMVTIVSLLAPQYSYAEREAKVVPVQKLSMGNNNATLARQVKAAPVPKISRSSKAASISAVSTRDPISAVALEHAKKKKDFVQTLEKEAKEYKQMIKTIKDPEVKKAKESEFQESRKQKITAFLEEEKRRELAGKPAISTQNKSAA